MADFTIHLTDNFSPEKYAEAKQNMPGMFKKYGARYCTVTHNCVIYDPVIFNRAAAALVADYGPDGWNENKRHLDEIAARKAPKEPRWKQIKPYVA